MEKIILILSKFYRPKYHYKIVILLSIIFSFELFQPLELLSQNKIKLDSLFQIIKENKHDTLVIKANIEIGNLYRNVKPDTSLYYYNKAIQLSCSNDKLKYHALAMHLKGNVFYYQGNYDSAISNYSHALNIRKQIKDDIGVSQTLNNIGNTYVEQGNHIALMQYYYQSLEIKKKLQNNRKAFTETQNEMRKKYDPYYWAAFELIE